MLIFRGVNVPWFTEFLSISTADSRISEASTAWRISAKQINQVDSCGIRWKSIKILQRGMATVIATSPQFNVQAKKNISFLPGKNMKVLTICLILFPQTFQVGKYGTKVWELTSHFAEQRFPSETTPEIIVKEISQKNTLQICIKCSPPPLQMGPTKNDPTWTILPQLASKLHHFTPPALSFPNRPQPIPNALHQTHHPGVQQMFFCGWWVNNVFSRHTRKRIEFVP